MLKILLGYTIEILFKIMEMNLTESFCIKVKKIFNSEVSSNVYTYVHIYVCVCVCMHTIFLIQKMRNWAQVLNEGR